MLWEDKELRMLGPSGLILGGVPIPPPYPSLFFKTAIESKVSISLVRAGSPGCIAMAVLAQAT